MASTAHCFYCFESLSASFERREPLSLARVEQLWEQYQKFKLGGAPDKAAVPSAEEHVDDDDDVIDDDEEVAAEDDEDVGEESEDNEPETRNGTQAPARLQLPSISRLQGHSPSASTPSTPSLSTNSSQSALTNPSSVSSASSQTSSKSSFFSLPGRRNSKRSEPTPIPTPARTESETYPLFVTWNTVSRHGHKSLRGCIGTFEAQDLPSGLKTYALTS
jgi:AMME syndrome candidate gene 1 protein